MIFSSAGRSYAKLWTRRSAFATHKAAEVAELVSYGLTNRAIADRLYISESTVKVHVQHILRKLNASKRAQTAARVAPR